MRDVPTDPAGSDRSYQLPPACRLSVNALNREREARAKINHILRQPNANHYHRSPHMCTPIFKKLPNSGHWFSTGFSCPNRDLTRVNPWTPQGVWCFRLGLSIHKTFTQGSIHGGNVFKAQCWSILLQDYMLCTFANKDQTLLILLGSRSIRQLTMNNRNADAVRCVNFPICRTFLPYFNLLDFLQLVVVDCPLPFGVIFPLEQNFPSARAH